MALPNKTKALKLVKRPVADEKLEVGEHFELVELDIPALSNKEVLVRTDYLSCDPTQRIWVNDIPQYMPPVAVGEIMRSGAVGTVVASNHPNFAEGDLVSGLTGWTEYAVTDGSQLTKLPAGTPVDMSMGPIGLTGLTAYFGLVYIGKPKPGDYVLVSGAAGATGSMVTQIAVLMGCKVVGIAGGPEKCEYVKSLGAVECIDYKNEDAVQRIAELGGVQGLKGGFDIYFDNVGGEILNAALGNISMGARVILCGAISGYKKVKQEQYGPSNYINLLMRRGTMQGFIILDFASDFEIAAGRMATWVQQGKIKAQTDLQEGPLEHICEVLDRIFTGKNKGKQVMKLNID